MKSQYYSQPHYRCRIGYSKLGGNTNSISVYCENMSYVYFCILIYWNYEIVYKYEIARFKPWYASSYSRCLNLDMAFKKGDKGFPYSLLSAGPGADPVYRHSARRWLQVIYPTVGCHYFLPGLRLPSQPQSITAPWPVPSYSAWWQRHIGVNNLPKVVTHLFPESDLNPCPRLVDRKFNATPDAPPHHLWRLETSNTILETLIIWTSDLLHVAKPNAKHTSFNHYNCSCSIINHTVNLCSLT